MEINLRKANAIQAEVRRAINAVEAKATISVNEYTQDVAGDINGASVLYQVGINRKEQLVNALYNIRNEVAIANATAGINIILGQVERFDQLIKLHTEVASGTLAKPLEELTARLDKLRAAPADSNSVLYGNRYSNVDASVVTPEVLANAKAKVKELRRERQNLQDKLLGLNVNTTIKLEESDVFVLKDEGIL